jgi:peptide/nickel transport system substrate-binding protein
MRLILLLLFVTQTLFASTLYKTLSSNPSRLNPLLATDSASSNISGYIFNGLLKYDKDANIVGDLASSYKIVTPTKIVFHLRKNVLWHDGVKFTAEDVLFTYSLMKLAMDGNARRISTPYSTDFKNVKDVIVKDPYTVEVIYTKPYFKALEIWMMGMVPKHLLKDVDNYMTADFNKKPIGTGPYKLKRMEISKSIILEAYDKYFEHKANIEKILYSIVPDATTNFYLLQKGEIDVNGLTPLQLEKKVDKSFNDKYQIIEQIAKAYTYIGFNFKRKLFQDPRVREAIKLGIDKKELVDILFFKHGQACNGPFLPGSFAYNDRFEANVHNKKRARELLEEAGFTKEKPLEFELVTNTGNSIRLAAAQVIQYQLAKVGIVVNLRVLEWQAFLNTKVFAQDFDVVLLGWGLSLTPDAYAIWHSDGVDQKGGYNFVSYENREVDKLIIEAESTTSKEKIAQLYRKIFALIVHDNPYVFLYIPNDIATVNKNISPIIKSIVGLEHNQIDWIKQ